MKHIRGGANEKLDQMSPVRGSHVYGREGPLRCCTNAAVEAVG